MARRSLLPNVTADHATSEQIPEIFSTINSGEKSRFGAPVSKILIPALIQFESMVLKKMESLHKLIVSHDLRLEVLEKAMLSSGQNEQRLGNKNKQSERDKINDIIRSEEMLPVVNTSTFTEATVTEDGSGETETVNFVTIQTHRPTQVDNWKVPEYYEIAQTSDICGAKGDRARQKEQKSPSTCLCMQLNYLNPNCLKIKQKRRSKFIKILMEELTRD
ncbi:hypothetical protein Btru_077292 [Bulinus truncatus]|nr:hypothetical protein Btru_077292 [Bulinus truncatus]